MNSSEVASVDGAIPVFLGTPVYRDVVDGEVGRWQEVSNSAEDGWRDEQFETCAQNIVRESARLEGTRSFAYVADGTIDMLRNQCFAQAVRDTHYARLASQANVSEADLVQIIGQRVSADSCSAQGSTQLLSAFNDAEVWRTVQAWMDLDFAERFWWDMDNKVRRFGVSLDLPSANASGGAEGEFTKRDVAFVRIVARVALASSTSGCVESALNRWVQRQSDSPSSRRYGFIAAVHLGVATGATVSARSVRGNAEGGNETISGGLEIEAESATATGWRMGSFTDQVDRVLNRDALQQSIEGGATPREESAAIGFSSQLGSTVVRNEPLFVGIRVL